MPQGTYTISVTFDVDQLAYAVLGQPDLTSTPTPTPKLAPSIDSKTLTITKGFKDQIKILNAGGASTIDQEVKDIIDACYRRAKYIIRKYQNVLEKCAELLLEKEKITREEFESLFEGIEVSEI